MIEYDKFRLSLKRLEEQNRNYRQGNPMLSNLDREGIAESVIQRFETCYDCLWKVMKRYLTEELGVVETPNSPKPVFRLAYENYLLTRHWHNGCDMPMPESKRHMTTTARRHKPVSRW